MPVQIAGFTIGNVAEVDATPKAARTILYDSAGNVIPKADRGVITPGTSYGLPISGSDYMTNRFARVLSDGALVESSPTLMLWDPLEGAALNTNIWISTLTTWTVASVASGILTFNPGSSAATTTGNVLLSHQWVPRMPRSPIAAKFRVKPNTHFNNNLHELGFGSPTSATAASIGNGACWRKDSSGQWLPVLSLNGTEMLGAVVSNATFIASVPVTDYAEFEVIVFDDRVEYIISTMGGAIVSHQVIDWNKSGSNNANFSVGHLQAMMRSYNSGATGTAVQMIVAGVACYLLDQQTNMVMSHQASYASRDLTVHPTSFTQLANWTNNVAPTTRTPSNTAAGETTLGGMCSWSNGANSFGVSDTLDLIIFGAQAPTNQSYVITGIRIDTLNLGATNGATLYTIIYGIAANISAVSLATAAPYDAKRVALGAQSVAAAALVGAPFTSTIDHVFQTPIVIHPGRFVDIVARVISGTATASQVIRTICLIEGYAI